MVLDPQNAYKKSKLIGQHKHPYISVLTPPLMAIKADRPSCFVVEINFVHFIFFSEEDV